MAYTYQVEFEISHNQMEELRIGSALEKIIGYLRTLLPNEMGFINARAMYTLDTPGMTHVCVQSSWDQWEDLLAHQGSRVAERKVLTELKPHITLEDLTVHVLEEVP
jgi:hypothetical protein